MTVDAERGHLARVLTVLAGAVGAQLLPVLAAPLITRLCTPAQIGGFSTWLGVAATASVVATLRMETPMMLEPGAAEQGACMRVVGYWAALVGIMLSLLAVAARAAGLQLACMQSWPALLTLGLASWLMAYHSIAIAYAGAHQAFGAAAKTKIAMVAAVTLAQLTLLALWDGSLALPLGQLAGMLIGAFAARRYLRLPALAWHWLPRHADWQLVRRHARFVHFSLPSDLLSTLVGQLPILLIGSLHGAAAAGMYALTHRVLAAPASVLSNSILEVFKPRAVREWRAHGHCLQAYHHTFKLLLAVGLVPSVLLWWLAPDLFALVFGSNWRAAGEMARTMAPLYLVGFLASPLGYVLYVTGRQQVELGWQAALLVVTVGAFLLPGGLERGLLAYTWGRVALYLLYLGLSYTAALAKPLKESSDAH